MQRAVVSLPDGLAAQSRWLLGELCAHQQKRVLDHARRLNGRVTADDIMNPIDVPELSASPEWNYEDGVLAGYRAAQAALRALAAGGRG